MALDSFCFFASQILKKLFIKHYQVMVSQGKKEKGVIVKW